MLALREELCHRRRTVYRGLHPFRMHTWPSQLNAIQSALCRHETPHASGVPPVTFVSAAPPIASPTCSGPNPLNAIKTDEDDKTQGGMFGKISGGGAIDIDITWSEGSEWMQAGGEGCLW